jgi:hypothetical protein
MIPARLMLYYACLLLSLTCQAAEHAVMSTEVNSPAETANKLNIDNVYRMIQLKHRQYYAGFSIDSDGINHPVLIEVSSGGAQQHQWGFEDIISDIFIFNGLVSVVLDSGQSFSLLNNVWIHNQQSLLKNARVVFSDGERHLIVCSPSSLFKDSTHAAGCESFNPHWKLSFSWQDFQPRVCGGYLYAVTWEQKHNQRLRIDPASGKIIEQSAYSGEHICAAFN